jgi:hypothetical protein
MNAKLSPYDPEPSVNAAAEEVNQVPTPLEQAIGDSRRTLCSAVSAVDAQIKHGLDGWFKIEHSIAGNFNTVSR